MVDKGYGDKKDYEVYPGVIVGFYQFKNLPTIVVAYIENSYSEIKLKFVYINESNKNTEIVQAEPEEILLDKGEVVRQLDREIEKKEAELLDLNKKKAYFQKCFQSYFKI